MTSPSGRRSPGCTAASRPCADRCADSLCEGKADLSVGQTVEELSAFLEGHPGLVVEDSRAITIDGREGRLMDVDVAPTWTATCEEWAGLTTFVPLLGDGRRLTADRMVNDSWWLGPGGTPGQPSNPLRIILLDLGDSSVAAIFIAAGRPADQDALLERAMPVVESFRFAD